MDPALRELLRGEPGDQVIEAIIRFRRPRVELPGVRIVTRFGSIATCRLLLSDVPRVWADRDVVSLKAARALGEEQPDPGEEGRAEVPGMTDGVDLLPAVSRRPPGLGLTGATAVVGGVDWGFDPDHPNFKHPDGSTRLIAL